LIDSVGVSTNSQHLLIATAPAVAAGNWNLGTQILSLPIDAAGSWQLSLIAGIGLRLDEPGVMSALTIGAAFWLPLFGVALLVSYFWSRLFSRLRGRLPDSGWLLHAWIFSLLLPATMPLGFAALALSFGLVFGCHVFGGTGRYLVHPSLLAVVFIAFAYPALVDATVWLPGGLVASAWSIAAAGGSEAATAVGISLLDAFIGREVGAIGTTSMLASLVGALYLIVTRRAAAAVVVGGVAAVLACALFTELSWPWQLALGNFAFVLAFVATDPTTQPRTAVGCLLFGAMFGTLTIILRTADPSLPEGTWAALLLASLVIPSIDYATDRLCRDEARETIDASGGAPK